LDGHGTTGDHVAEYARRELIRELGAQTQREASAKAINEGIRRSFLRVDESIPRKSADGRGATASIVLRKNDTLVVLEIDDHS
jgi:serine/threonine protein phosphatase PrpC